MLEIRAAACLTPRSLELHEATAMVSGLYFFTHPVVVIHRKIISC